MELIENKKVKSLYKIDDTTYEVTFMDGTKFRLYNCYITSITDGEKINEPNLIKEKFEIYY